MHQRGVLHRDIQLGNCVLGLEPSEKTIYMIDFGFSKFYLDQRTGRHIPDSNEPRDFIGNYWFSSVRVHCRNKGVHTYYLACLHFASAKFAWVFAVRVVLGLRNQLYIRSRDVRAQARARHNFQRLEWPKCSPSDPEAQQTLAFHTRLWI